MKNLFSMEKLFGGFLSNGDQANAFRFTEVEPALALDGEVVFDFLGVTNMTSSFCNALFATLVAHHPETFFTKVRFQNCDELIREFIMGAIALGKRESKEFA